MRAGISRCGVRRWALGVVSGGTLGLGLLSVTPVPEALLQPPRQSVEFYDRNGIPLRRLLVDESRYSTVCRLEDISPHVISATLSAEDKRFWIHPGVDPLAIARAGINGFRDGSIRSGASTITQQLVKGVDPRERTVWMKVREAWVALRVELTWSKKRILTEYLNRLDYGNLQIGIASASRHYFAKPPADLSPAESAFLAGLPKAPGRLNPRRNADAAASRKRWVLERMRENGWIDSDAWERSCHEVVEVDPAGGEFRAPLFVNRLLMRSGMLPPGGGAVHTTLDLILDRKVEEVLSSNLTKLPVPGVAGAVVVLDNASGEVLSMAGYHTDAHPHAARIDGAWTARSPGSVIKPFTYALALEHGMQPCSVVPDVPTAFETPTGLYRPQNYNLQFHGPVSLRFALGSSLNVPAVRVLEHIGGAEVLHRLMLRLGVTSLRFGPDYYGLGLTLGNGEVRLLEMVNAYAAIARMGAFQPYRLVACDGAARGKPDRVFSPETAYLIADMLSDNGARAPGFGLDSELQFDFPVACKTGTSSDYRDNWTIGFTPEFTVGVWVGRPDGAGMKGVSGVAGAAPVFHAVMEYLHQTRGTACFRQPDSVRSYWVDSLTGRGASSISKRACWEKCSADPGPPRQEDYDRSSRVLLPDEYREWLESKMAPMALEVALGTGDGAFRVLEPAQGTLFYLDSDVPRESQTVALSAVGSGAASLEWKCDSAPVVLRGGLPRLELREGFHVVRVREPGTNRVAETWVEVRPL